MAIEFKAKNQVSFDKQNMPDETQLTIMIWFNAATVSAEDRIMLGKTASALNNSSNSNYYLCVNSNRTVKARVRLSSTKSILSPENIFVLDTWNHAAFTYKSDTGNFILYVNGQPVVSTIEGGNFNQSFPEIMVGGRNNSTSNNRFKGKLDDARIYNRELSPKEIEHIYNARGHDGIRDSLFLWAKMNELSENTTVGDGDVIDYSPNNFISTTTSTNAITFVGSEFSYTERTV